MAAAWKRHTLTTNGHDMAWFETGEGPVLIVIHGSLDHVFCRGIGELLADRYRCVLYDQRGSGESPLHDPSDPDALNVDLFVADIDALRDAVGLDRVAILGHSWGCALGLLYAQTFPDRLSHLILVGPGPLNREMGEFYRGNRDRMAYPLTRAELETVRKGHQRLAESGQVTDEDDRELMEAWAPVMFYSRDQAARFAESFVQSGGHRRHAKGAVGFEQEDQLRHADRITAETLVLYGYQDYEPITQAYLIREHIPQTEIFYLNECGHMVWMEQPEQFVDVVSAFLSK